ncbi:MAG TPA: WXG100 family type VII secretion target [Candidatus Dormibacteraeota bacterium]
MPAPHDGNPEELRRAAWQLDQCAEEVRSLVVRLRATVEDLTQGQGEWRSPVADAFRTHAWEPIRLTLTSVAHSLEDGAASLRHAATAIENAQSDRRRAEALAVAAGVGVALTVLSFGISDAVAAEAAAGAAALMARAATAIAGAMRAVVLALDEAGAAIRVLTVTMRTWGTAAGYTAGLTLPRLAFSPAGAGVLGAVGSAALGDTRPADLIQAFAISYVEGKAGEAEGEGEASPRRGAGLGGSPGRSRTFERYLDAPPPTTGEEVWLEITTEEGVLVGTRAKGARAHVHELPDDLAHVEAYYARLRSGGVDVTPPGMEAGASVTRLPDGTHITFRARSRSGPPTLEFTIESRGHFKLKIKE